jgi:oligopeptide transport system permease protein
VIYGARPTVTIGLLVTAGSLLVAVVLGSTAGYLGGVPDAVIGRLADMFVGFPFVLGALVLLTVIPERNVLSVSLALLVFGWPAMTRLMRSTVLAEARRDYALAARSLGASRLRILRRHILPNALAPVIVYATITAAGAMVAEASLTFLGVGLQAPAISWGLELAAAQHDFQQYPQLLIFPGLALAVTVVSFIAIGDALRDALDPRLR